MSSRILLILKQTALNYIEIVNMFLVLIMVESPTRNTLRQTNPETIHVVKTLSSIYREYFKITTDS